MDDSLKIYFPPESVSVPSKFVVIGTASGDHIRSVQGQITKANDKSIPGKPLFFTRNLENAKSHTSDSSLHLWAIYFAPEERGTYRFDVFGIGEKGEQLSKVTNNIKEFEVRGTNRTASITMFSSGIEFIYPTPNQILTEFERNYFSAIMYSPTPMLSVTLWKSVGVPNKTADSLTLVDSNSNTWSASFPLLDTGSNQILEATNTNNESESIQISI